MQLDSAVWNDVMVPSCQAKGKEVTLMRSWFRVMVAFIGVIVVLILLILLLEKGCRGIQAAILSNRDFSCAQQACSAAGALPWQSPTL